MQGRGGVPVPPSPQTVIEMLSISGVLLSMVWGLYVLAIGAVGVVGNYGWRWRAKDRWKEGYGDRWMADWVVLLERRGWVEKYRRWCGERRHDGPEHG